MPSQNITITVPNGTTYYQNPSQLCLPSSAADIIVFFFGNYLAHVATVRSRPQDTFVENLVKTTFCLFFPAYGLSIAVPKIISCATLEETYLKKATRAGSLVMVVRNENWKPKKGDEISYAILHCPRQSKKSKTGTTRSYKFQNYIIMLTTCR